MAILADALQDAGITSPRKGPDDGVDAVLRTRDGRRIELQVKWAGEGWPEDVRDAARAVGKRWPEKLVLVARHLSPGAIEWLRARNANWADESGQVRILGPGGLIVIREPTTQPSPRTPGAEMRWSSSARTVVEAILARPETPLRVGPLAAESGWSAPQCGEVLRSLDAHGWTVKRGPARGPGAHRELIDKDGLLAAWSAAVAEENRQTRVAHRAGADAMGLLRGTFAADMRRLDWAASGWAGLELSAPYTTIVPSLQLYVSERNFGGALTNAIKRAGLRELDEGGLVTFWRTDPHVLGLAEVHFGIPVASPPRLYADLSTLGVRGQDAASHLKTQVLDAPHHGSRAHKGRQRASSPT